MTAEDRENLRFRFGEWLEYAALRFRTVFLAKGEAYSDENVRKILRGIMPTLRKYWRGAGKKIVTSENAAPFSRLLAEGTVSLYTEGYPNTAVRRLLEHFAAAGVTADHEGDADLDGFRA